MRSAESICLKLDSRGAVRSLRFGGVEFAAPSAGNDTLFVCCLRDFVGNPLQLDARCFSAVQRRECGEEVRLVFSGCDALPGTVVEIDARCCGAEIRWRIAVSPGREDFKVEWIDFPRIRLRRFSDGNYLLPFGKPEEVREEVKKLVETAGPEGFVLTTCNIITDAVPVENAKAMYYFDKE